MKRALVLLAVLAGAATALAQGRRSGFAQAVEPNAAYDGTFTFDAATDTQPVWSSDGRRIAWMSNRGGHVGFYSKLADGSGSDELLYQFGDGPAPNLTDWTRDGRFLIYNRASDIWAVPVTEGTVEDRKPVPLVQSDGGQLGGRGRLDTGVDDTGVADTGVADTRLDDTGVAARRGAAAAAAG